MTTYSYAQLEGLWIQAGGAPSVAPVMAAIALAESSGNPGANNPTDNNGTQTSWGLWQLSDGTHNMPVPNINDPLVNAQQAIIKSNNGKTLSPWGTYDSGAYQQYLQGGVAPVSVGGGGPLTGGSLATGGNLAASSGLGALFGSGTSASSGGAGSLGLGSTAPPAPGASGCAITILGVCVWQNSWTSGLIGGLLVGAGGLVMLAGAAFLAAYGLESSVAHKALGTGAKAVGGTKALAAAPGALNQARSDRHTERSAAANEASGVNARGRDELAARRVPKGALPRSERPFDASDQTG